MKRGAKIVLFFLLAVFLTSCISALANPAAVYCKELGKEFGNYEYKIKQDSKGNEYGVCITPDKIEREAFKFLEGKTGLEYSYCSKRGYDSRVADNKVICIKKDKSQRALFSSDSQSQESDEIEMTKLMNLQDKLGGLDIDAGKKIKSKFYSAILSSDSEIKNSNTQDKQILDINSEIQRQQLNSIYSFSSYSYWDWRAPPSNTIYLSSNFNFFDSSNGWMTPIKDQGGCGSCWSFAIHGSSEAVYNINQNDSRLDPDLSEQNSVSCDDTCYSAWPWICQAGCSGGYMDLGLKFMMDSGTVDESCFPYSGTEQSCQNICSDSSSRKWLVTNYDTTWPDGGDQLILSINQTKQWIIDYGPIAGAMNMSARTTSDSGIWRCSKDNGADHGIVVVGYNDTGNDSRSYWIIKNSWGTGSDESGYFKLGFNECNLSTEFEYAENILAPNFKPSITLNSPTDNNITSNTLVIFNFTISNKVYKNSTCDLIINNITRNSTSLAVNGTSNTLTFDLSLGDYNWSISCWENKLGIVNISSSRAISIVEAIYPTFTANITYTDSEFKRYNNFTANISLTDNSELSTAWLSSNHTGSLVNYTYSLSGTNQNLSKSFNITTSLKSFSLRWYFNDSLNNINSTSWKTILVLNTQPSNLTILNQSWPMNSNKTINLSLYFTDIDGDEINYTSTSASNITIIINQTSKLALLVPNMSFNGTNYIQFIANDSTNITQSNNITLEVYKPVITINYTRFSGQTTNFSNLSYYTNLPIIIENQEYGKINFSSINLSSSSIDINTNINISSNRIEINSTALSIFNASATLTLYNVSFSNPRILKDNGVCSAPLCNIISNSLGILVFNVSSFSIYTSEETPSNPPSSGGGGGSTTDTIKSPIKLTLNQAISSYSLELSKEDQILFPTLAGANHALTIKNVSSTRIDLNISSNLINLFLYSGEERKLSLDSIDYYDFYIKLNSISNNKANLTIKSIYEQKTTQENINISQNNSNNTKQVAISSSQENHFNSGAYIAVTGILLILILVYLSYYFYKKKNKKTKRSKKSST